MDFVLMFYLWIMCFMLIIMVHKFMLVVLMVMELLVVSISFLMFSVMSVMGVEIYMIYYLIFSVCESVLGLMILVLIIRFHGNEMYFLLNLFKF